MKRLTLIDSTQQQVLAKLLTFVLDADAELEGRPLPATSITIEATDLTTMLASIGPHMAITVHITDVLAADLSMAADLAGEDPETAGLSDEQLPALAMLADALG